MRHDSRTSAVVIGSLESDMEFTKNDDGIETDIIRFKPGRMPPLPEHSQIEEAGTPSCAGDDPGLAGKPRSESAAAKASGASQSG